MNLTALDGSMYLSPMTGSASLSRCTAAILTVLALVAALLVVTPWRVAVPGTATDGMDHPAASLHAPRVAAQHGAVKQVRNVTGSDAPLPARALACRATAARALRQYAGTGAAPHDSALAGGYDATGPPGTLLT